MHYREPWGKVMYILLTFAVPSIQRWSLCAQPFSMSCSYDLTSRMQGKWNLATVTWSYGEGNGTPLQYSCLENPMDGGAWWAAVHGVAKSRTWLSNFTFTFSLSCIGEGNGNPLQCSCLENPRGRRAWWADVYGVTQSRTWLKWLSRSSSIFMTSYNPDYVLKAPSPSTITLES